MKCEAIYMHSPEYPVSKMCKALGVYENQYYRWIRTNERRKRRRQAEQELVDKVIKVFKDNYVGTMHFLEIREQEKLQLQESSPVFFTTTN